MVNVKFDLTEGNTAVMDLDLKNQPTADIEIIDNDFEIQNGVEKNYSTEGVVNAVLHALNRVVMNIRLNVELKDQDVQLMNDQEIDTNSLDIICQIETTSDVPIATVFINEYGQDKETEVYILTDMIEILEFINIELYDRKTDINLDEDLYQDDVEIAKNQVRDYLKNEANYHIKQALEIV